MACGAIPLEYGQVLGSTTINLIDYIMNSEFDFDLNDLSWREFLATEGFVVIRGIVSTDEISHARKLFWDHLEREKLGLSRLDVSTWDMIGNSRHGIQFDGAIIQSEAGWFLRGLPTVKRCFSLLWETEDLLVSMDSPIIWRPWWLKGQWKPVTEGLHLDQNPFKKPHRDCVQGV